MGMTGRVKALEAHFHAGKLYHKETNNYRWPIPLLNMLDHELPLLKDVKGRRTDANGNITVRSPISVV